MRLKVLRCASVAGLSFLGLFLILQQVTLNRLHSTPAVENDALEIVDQACRHPHLDHMNPLISKHIRDLEPLSCSPDPDWVEVRDGMVRVSEQAARTHGRILCKLLFVERADEFSNKKMPPRILRSGFEPQPLVADFFHVKCKAEDKQYHTNIMAGVARSKLAVKRAKENGLPANAMGLNVLIFGMDSMSRMHFLRKMPRTYRYLTEVLKATVLKGYNIVGDGTPQALIPILTGYSEPELPETRKRMSNSQFVDVYPFAWKNFTAAGYVTAWGEEQPHIGTFTYRLRGFKDMPTDHYMRSFYLEVNKVASSHAKLCLGDKPRHKVMMDWMEDFFRTYADVPRFGFGFLSELSHDDYNTVGHADREFAAFLRSLHDAGRLNDTMLVVMSDHGHRFAPIRASVQGKQEERMPMFAFALPAWVEQKYPLHMRNLRTNADRLVTPFDVHATLMTLLDPEVPAKGHPDARSISLFSEIPNERTCASASIEPHWCACLSWSEISREDDLAQKVGKATLNFINSLTDFLRTQCEELKLVEVTRLERLQPNKALLKFKQNADKDGFVGDFTDNTQVTEVLYQVQVLVSPSNGLYEAMITHNKEDETFEIKEHDLSRVNTYDMQDHCINTTHQGLGKYCYCRVQLVRVSKL